MKKRVIAKSILNCITVLFVFLGSLSLLNAQSADWTLQSEKNGVKLYSKIGNCGNSNMLFLKLENTNSAAKHVNYNVIIESSVRNMPLLPQSAELKASETKFGECNSNKELTIDIKNITNPKLLVILTTN